MALQKKNREKIRIWSLSPSASTSSPSLPTLWNAFNSSLLSLSREITADNFRDTSKKWEKIIALYQDCLDEICGMER